MNYRKEQELRQIKLFDVNKRNGIFRGKERNFVLKSPIDNFYSEEIYKDAVDYFHENKINWWGGSNPTSHTLSSQISCVNHLFPLRKDPKAVLSIAQQIDPDFDSVVELNNDEANTRGYISFEVVSMSDYLNESGKLTRGSNCTSIDAVIIATKNNKKCLLSIEWKYVESYSNEDKSMGNSGQTRLNSYCSASDYNRQLIQHSEYLKPLSDYSGSVYFFEPFYQLMRQTLWAEQLVKHQEEEILKADYFIHVLVVPDRNEQLLNKKYKCSGKNLEKTWHGCLDNSLIYRLLSPQQLFVNLNVKYNNLVTYLKERYW